MNIRTSIISPSPGIMVLSYLWTSKVGSLRSLIFLTHIRTSTINLIICVMVCPYLCCLYGMMIIFSAIAISAFSDFRTSIIGFHIRPFMFSNFGTTRISSVSSKLFLVYFRTSCVFSSFSKYLLTFFRIVHKFFTLGFYLFMLFWVSTSSLLFFALTFFAVSVQFILFVFVTREIL